MKWQVGQKLWMVPDGHHGKPREVEVVKVGRKWATINTGYPSYRINDKGRIDDRGYSSPGCCHESREEYEKRCAITVAWRELKDEFWSHAPEGVTLEDIETARELLKLSRRPA